MATSNNNALVTACILWGNDNESGTIKNLCQLFSMPEEDEYILGEAGYTMVKANLHPDLVRLIDFLGYDPENPTDAFYEDHLEDVRDVLSMVQKLLPKELSHYANEYFNKHKGGDSQAILDELEREQPSSTTVAEQILQGEAPLQATRSSLEPPAPPPTVMPPYEDTLTPEGEEILRGRKPAGNTP